MPSFRCGRRFERIRYFFWRIRHRKEIEEAQERWRETVAKCEILCKEALKEKDIYGERPLFIDMGMGLKIPVPVSKPGAKWEIGVEETKDGTLVPTILQK